ncbi:MAG TPA: DNA mismatch repair protein MutS [Candidatus Dormibacteraeota bacterium]|nr:DNA mismatch repair protein MutS [Candidatus Dormibacteraeota bacterium]
MKAFLMHPDRDFDAEPELPWNHAALVQDLGLDAVFAAMASGDALLAQVARVAVLASLTDHEAIGYRQRVLGDCLAQEPVVRDVYALAVEAIEGARKVYRGVFIERHPEAMLQNSLTVLAPLLGSLRRLRGIADRQAGPFRSEGFTRLFGMLRQELDDGFFQAAEAHLRQLRLRDGILISARLAAGNKGSHYTLRRPRSPRRSWGERVLGAVRSPYSMEIGDRDESGQRTLAELRDQGLNSAANALAQATDHIVGFFAMLRCELAFYVGCLNLEAALRQRGQPTCFPRLHPAPPAGLSARGLYDVPLALRLPQRVVGNDIPADHKALVMITGANQGGKSTVLSGVGTAQLMFQCGMFVAAASYSARACTGLFTHYRRQEDVALRSGRLDEELRRMSDIVDRLAPGGIVLCDESFSGTNEREGSEIARQVVRALLEAGVGVFVVTHFFELAHSIHREGWPTALFLRAERRPDGERTFRLVEGEPLPTSYGKDIYRRIFAPPAGGGPGGGPPPPPATIEPPGPGAGWPLA